MGAAGNIGKSFVDGNALDQRGEIVENVDDRIAEPLVVAKMAADKDQVRTELARKPDMPLETPKALAS